MPEQPLFGDPFDDKPHGLAPAACDEPCWRHLFALMTLEAPLLGFAQHLGKAPAHALHEARPLGLAHDVVGIRGFVIDLILIDGGGRDQKDIHS